MQVYCKDCEADHGPLIVKKLTNNCRHDRSEPDDKDKPLEIGTPDFIEQLKQLQFAVPSKGEDYVVSENGSEITYDYFQRNGFTKPIVVKNADGLGMSIPTAFKEANLIRFLDKKHVVQIINVRKQHSESYTLYEFLELLNIRKIAFNSLSIEVSKTKLKIEAPKVVRDLSWAETTFKSRDTKVLRYIA